MKASIMFRDDQKPLARAKVPISILGLPFSTAISAGGDPSDLRFDLSTSFDSGPGLRVSYRPNDSLNPFSLALKTGIGAFGSPISAPMSMSAEFSLLSPRGGPAFFLHFKPRLGDFSFVKTTASSALPTPPLPPPAPPLVNGGGGENGVYAPARVNGFQGTMVYPTVRGIDGILSGVEITARSILPLRNKAAVKFRWGVRVPTELPISFGDEEGGGGVSSVGALGRKRSRSWISPRDLPLLVMRKISIEQMPTTAVEVAETKNKKKDMVASSASSEVEALVAEQGMLRKAVEELRVEIERWRGKCGEDRNGGGKGVAANWKNGRRAVAATGGAGKEEMNEELKKALKSAGGN